MNSRPLQILFISPTHQTNLFQDRKNKAGFKQVVYYLIYIYSIYFKFLFSSRCYINKVQNSKGTERCTMKKISLPSLSLSHTVPSLRQAKPAASDVFFQRDSRCTFRRLYFFPCPLPPSLKQYLPKLSLSVGLRKR